MKILISIYFIALISSSLFSQPQKGNLLLGGGFSYSDTKEEASNLYDDQITSFVFNPSFNFYLNDFFTLGLSFTYSNIKNSQMDLNNFNSQRSSFIAKVKTYYIGPILSLQPKIINKLHFKGDFQLNFGFGSGDYRADGSSNYESEIDVLEFRITPGLIYFISPSLAISGSFGGIVFEDGEEVFTFPSLGNSPNSEETKNMNNVGFDFNPANFNLNLFFLFGGNKSSKE